MLVLVVILVERWINQFLIGNVQLESICLSLYISICNIHRINTQLSACTNINLSSNGWNIWIWFDWLNSFYCTFFSKYTSKCLTLFKEWGFLKMRCGSMEYQKTSPNFIMLIVMELAVHNALLFIYKSIIYTPFFAQKKSKSKNYHINSNKKSEYNLKTTKINISYHQKQKVNSLIN